VSVCDIGFAVNERVKRGEEWVNEATFVDVTMFGKTAEIAQQYLTKGAQAMIEGRLKLETWEKNGEKRSRLKVIGEKLTLLGSKATGSTTPATESRSTQTTDDGGFEGDDLPF